MGYKPTNITGNFAHRDGGARSPASLWTWPQVFRASAVAPPSSDTLPATTSTGNRWEMGKVPMKLGS